jgi:hypothetical protein
MQNKNTSHNTAAQSRNCAGCGKPGEAPRIRFDRRPDDPPTTRPCFVGNSLLMLCDACRSLQKTHDRRRARRAGGCK